MRSISALSGLYLLAVISVHPSRGAVVIHPIAELTEGPLPIELAQIPVNLGVAFEQIDAITFSIRGDLPTHTWLSCDVNFGCGNTPYTFDSWGVNLYKPGFVGNAVGYFSANGFTSLDLMLHDLGGGSNWSNLESGALQFVIYPIAEGIFVGTHYWDLISPPVVNLSEATLTFVGEFAPPPMPDYNGDGVVDAADFTMWRDGLGSDYTMADYDAWKSHFGAGGGSGAGSAEASPVNTAVPEPASVFMIVGAGLSLASLGRRAARGHTARSRS